MAIDFGINITAKGGAATKAIDNTTKSLDRLEREAKDARNAIQQTLSQKDRGSAGAIDKLVSGGKKATKVIDSTTVSLDRMADESRDASNALRRALSQNGKQTIAALSKISRVLEQTQENALITDARLSRMGKDIRDTKLRKFNKTLDDTKQKASQIGKLLKRVFAGIGIALVTRQLIGFSDQLTNVQNRLRLVTSTTSELTSTQKELFEIADRTRGSFEGTATIFNRLAISGKELGVGNQQLLQFTESLNQAIVLSGASSIEASNGLIQLSQGLASGALRGDELRSVLEQLPAVADVIAKELGVTRGELRKMGQEGKITAGIVLDAFKNARVELNQRFATTIPTIGQAFTKLQTKVIAAVGSFNEATKASEFLATAIIFIGDNIGTITEAVVVLASVWAVNYASKAMTKAIKATKDMTAAQLRSNLAIVAAAVAVGALVSKLQQQKENLEAVALAQKTVQEDSKFADIGAAIITRVKEIKRLEAAIKAQESRGGASPAQVARLEALKEQIASLKGLAKATGETAQAQIRSAQIAAEAAKEQRDSLARQKKILEDLKKPGEDFAKVQKDLGALLDSNKISQEQFNRALAEGRSEFDKSISKGASPTFDPLPGGGPLALPNDRSGAPDGFVGPLLENGTALDTNIEKTKELRKEVDLLADAGRSMAAVFTDTATDAIIDFVNTGEDNFKEFGLKLIQEIQRIIVKLLVLQLIQAATGTAPAGGGGGGGLISGLLNQGAQFGATVQPGQVARPVNEGGLQETFIPNRTGVIQPNPANQLQAAQAPPSIQIVNVMSMEAVKSAISAGDFDDQIVNVAGRNPQKYRQVIS